MEQHLNIKERYSKPPAAKAKKTNKNWSQTKMGMERVCKKKKIAARNSAKINGIQYFCGAAGTDFIILSSSLRTATHVAK